MHENTPNLNSNRLSYKCRIHVAMRHGGDVANASQCDIHIKVASVSHCDVAAISQLCHLATFI